MTVERIRKMANEYVNDEQLLELEGMVENGDIESCLDGGYSDIEGFRNIVITLNDGEVITCIN